MIILVAVLAWFVVVGESFESCPLVDGRPGAWVECVKPEASRQAARSFDVPEGAVR